MISYSQALEIINQQAKLVANETIYTTEIVGRICGEDISSPMDIQQFNNSAMDGFALHAEDVQSASDSNLITLKCLGKIAAGEAASDNLTPQGCCWEIMTGAIMPDDCDSVVPVENIQRDSDENSGEESSEIIFNNSCKKNDHLRFKGEDFKVGEAVLKTGTKLTSEHILVLATLGVNQVCVRKKVKVALLSTGKEVINDLKQPLQTGQIYNSTAPYILSVLKENGAEAKFYGTLPDEQAEFAPLMEKISADGVQLIISTGAVSAGKHDFIKPALIDMEAEILFHKVFIRPGKPNLFAKLKNGTIFFGLPGNPVASVAGFRFFVNPLLRAFAGLYPEKAIRAKLTNSVNVKADFRFFLKAKFQEADDGKIEATVLKGQKSFMVSPFTEANAWAVIPEADSELNAGEMVDVYPL